MRTRAEAAALKPRFGNECNGCGLCCIVQPCALANEYLSVTEGPCPALEWEDDRSWCGLVRSPGTYLGFAAFGDNLVGGLVGKALGIGMGCDADDEPGDQALGLIGP